MQKNVSESQKCWTCSPNFKQGFLINCASAAPKECSNSMPHLDQVGLPVMIPCCTCPKGENYIARASILPNAFLCPVTQLHFNANAERLRCIPCWICSPSWSGRMKGKSRLELQGKGIGLQWAREVGKAVGEKLLPCGAGTCGGRSVGDCGAAVPECGAVVKGSDLVVV